MKKELPGKGGKNHQNRDGGQLPGKGTNLQAGDEEITSRHED
jgi:hypothetical protein